MKIDTILVNQTFLKKQSYKYTSDPPKHYIPQLGICLANT